MIQDRDAASRNRVWKGVHAPMPKRVLIIDDDDGTRLLLRQILEPEGYELHELESAARLEGVIEEFAPDLILTDIIMPGRDGLAVLKTLRSDPATQSISVVLVSAKSFEGDQRAALNA